MGGMLWVGLMVSASAASPDEVARTREALCQSLEPLLRIAATGRDAGLSEAEMQAAMAQRAVTDPEVRRWTVLSIARVYRDRRPGPVIAAEVVGQCRQVLADPGVP